MTLNVGTNTLVILPANLRFLTEFMSNVSRKSGATGADVVCEIAVVGRSRRNARSSDVTSL